MSGLWPLLWLGFGVCVGLGVLFLLYSTFRYIPNNKVGIVEKLWSPTGSVKSGLIALNGEAGFQPALLRGELITTRDFVHGAGGDAALLKVFQRKIEAASLGVFAHVAEDVG